MRAKYFAAFMPFQGMHFFSITKESQDFFFIMEILNRVHMLHSCREHPEWQFYKTTGVFRFQSNEFFFIRDTGQNWSSAGLIREKLHSTRFNCIFWVFSVIEFSKIKFYCVAKKSSYSFYKRRTTKTLLRSKLRDRVKR